MFNIGDVVLAGYGLKYVIAKVNKSTYDVVSLFDVERGCNMMQVSRYPMKRLDFGKFVKHIDFTLPAEPETKAYAPGDILYNSWGWEQTNIDFYQVIKSTDKTVWVREISQVKTPDKDGFMTGKCIPVKDSFKGEEQKHGIRMFHGEQYVNCEYGTMQLWNGELKAYSCYA